MSRSPEAERARLRGNDRLSLAGPGRLLLVESGFVAVFAVRPGGGGGSGRRRFLFGCGRGQALVGLPAGADEHVLAFALEASVLSPLAGAPPEAAAAIERWIADWRRSLPGAELPAVDEPTDHIALDRFHAAAIAAVRERDLVERQHEKEDAAERERRTERATSDALAGLCGALGGVEERPAGSTALHAAVAEVGRALGVGVRAPAAWERAALQADPLSALCRASRLRHREVQLEGAWWRRDAGPLVAFLREGGQPVALVQPRPGRYTLFDPRTGTTRPVGAAEAAALDPRASLLYRPLPARASRAGELLAFALRGRSRDLWTILAAAAAATLVGMLVPQATALLVDRAIPDGDGRLLVEIGLGLLAAAGGAAVFRLSQGIATLRLETAADAATQAAVWDRLLSLPFGFFRRYSTGDLQSRATAISQIRAHLGGATLRTLFSSVVLLLNLLLLLAYSPALTLVAVAVAAVSLVATVVSGLLILRSSRPIFELGGRLFGLTVQLIHGVAKLRVAAAEERAFVRWAADYARLVRLELGRRTIADRVAAFNLALAAGGIVVLYAAAATLVRSEAGPSLGAFLAFNVAYGTFVGAVLSLSASVTDVATISILRERARPILDATPEVDEAKGDPGALAGRVDLERVAFRYEPAGPLVLDDVSIQADAGRFVALVGPSGGGKSTVLRILLGLERPQAGSVRFDGQELSGLDVHAVRRQLGVVLQTGRINAGSIFDNVAAGAAISLDDAWRAARAVGFADEIASLPMGLHTVISEGGSNLSGGQRQRLLLARALVHRPRVLLLDEATSALDNRTQAIVAESLAALEVTRIVIAHRLSTVRRADRIYVVGGGRIVQQGDFGTLSREPGLFARLIARQTA